MPSSKEYLQYILEQLSCIEDITYRAMMGEYIIYYKGKIVGGIYDDRLLVKDTAAAKKYMPDTSRKYRIMEQKKCCWLKRSKIKRF